MRFVYALTFLSAVAASHPTSSAAQDARLSPLITASHVGLPGASDRSRRALAPLTASWRHPSGGCIYLSERSSGTVNVYSSTPPYPMFGALTAVGIYGWGIDDNAKTVFIGTSNDSIDEYAPCTAAKVLKSLHGTGGGPPTAIAAEPNGAIYATEWPTGGVDYWDPGGNLTHHPSPTAYGLAVDKTGHLYLTGFNASQSQLIVLKCNSTLARCEQVISVSGGFPGGVQVDTKSNVYVDDQAGALYSFACSLSACVQSGSFTYSNGTNPLDYTAIALDAQASHIWAANIFTCSSSSGFCGDAQRQSLPLSAATLDGNTSQWNNAEPMGIAVWPPDKT